MKCVWVIVAFVVAAQQNAAAQAVKVPLAFSSIVKPAAAMAPALRSAVAEKARRYPFAGFAVFGADSILLVFSDSSYTDAAQRAGTWMFGPPVTAAEADGCPPAKVLGRQVARALFRAMGRPSRLQQVVVSVHGTVGKDRWSVVDMYFYPDQLSGKWAGDPIP